MKNSYRIKRNKYDLFVNILCLILLFGMFLYLILNWGSFPDKIPGHYNYAGEVDRWGNKSELWICPVIALLFYIGFTVLEAFPRLWNTGVRITEENRDRVYRLLKNVVVTMKGVIVVIFTFLSVNSALAKPLPVWFLPVFLILMFGSPAVYLIKMGKAGKAK